MVNLTSECEWLVKTEIFCSVEVLKVIRGGRKPQGGAMTSHPCTRFCSREPQMGDTMSFAVTEHVMEL